MSRARSKVGQSLSYIALTALALPVFAGWASASMMAKAATAFAAPAFQGTWERTDKPVALGQAKRSWYWGPAPDSEGLQEDYAEGVGGKRLVQYFDKSRMEINDPKGDPTNKFYVTNGLLTVELISGKMQVGNNTYVDRYPADILLASDADDANGPTYRSLQGVSNTPLGNHDSASRMGQPATATIFRSGVVGDDPGKASYPKVNIAYFEQATKHNIPQAIWEFLNSNGPLYDPATGKTANAPVSDPWFYATGYPISEAYWARTKIEGKMQDVLIQAFERRIVTYVPAFPADFQVQMGNIGQHYYDWRYKDAGRSTGSTGSPVPNNTPIPTISGPAQPSPTVAPPPPTAVPDPNADCSGIPDSFNMVVTPVCAPAGTLFSLTGSGFHEEDEGIKLSLTYPDQTVLEAAYTDHEVGGMLTTSLQTSRGMPLGIYSYTMEGLDTHRKALGYFKLTPPRTHEYAASVDISTVTTALSPFNR